MTPMTLVRFSRRWRAPIDAPVSASAIGGGGRSDDRTSAEILPIYTAIWQNISREDVNVSNRIGWAIGLSAGQLTAISFMAVRATDYSKGGSWPVAISLSVFFIALLGVVFTARTKLGVDAAHKQISFLRSEYNTHRQAFERLGLPRPFGESNDRKFGGDSSSVYPLALLIFWSFITLGSGGASIWTIARAAAVYT